MQDNSEFHARLTSIFSDLTTNCADYQTWAFVRRKFAAVLDPGLPIEERRQSLLEAVRVFQDSEKLELANALEHHLLLKLSETTRCPAVQYQLAQLLLRLDHVPLKPISLGGRVLSYELGTISTTDAERYSRLPRKDVLRGAGESSPISCWIRGLAFAEGLAVDRSGAMDAQQAIAGLSCLAQVILNLHCIADRAEADQLAEHISRTGPELWHRLQRKLVQAQQARAEFRTRVHSFSDDMYDMLKLRLRSELYEAQARRTARVPEVLPPKEPDPQPATSKGMSARVVTEPIPPAAYKEDREQLKLYEALTTPLELRCLLGVDDLSQRLDRLHAEFPWAHQAIAEVRTVLEPRALLGRLDVKLPHLLLAGPPGAGKSRLARRLAALLNLPFIPINVGGSADVKMIVGTARGWASAAPSPLLASMLTHKTPSGLVLLDELDKGASSFDGARIVSAVLAFLEPETARQYRDGYLNAACDLSWLSFVGTVNALKLPEALLSRFRIVYVPSPGPEHRPILAKTMAAELAEQWGVSPDVFPPLPAELLARAGTSARDMRRAIEDYLADWLRDTLRPSALH
ncbi:AAA family ATPase [Roseateles sp. BYS87W]|uniref:AAA family ATPase n=1 Tax=Pelomonas baiyunensis TaxID=3299026 RepID=A0ABW7H1T5_9BURK